MYSPVAGGLLWVAVLFAVPNGAAAASQRPTEVDWKARLLAEAPEEGRRLEAAVSHWQGTLETNRREYPTPRPGRPDTVETHGKGQYLLSNRVGGALLVTTNVPEDGKKAAYGFNGAYDFDVIKSSPGASFSLRAYRPHSNNSGPVNALARAWDAHSLRTLLAAEDISGAKLSNILNGSAGDLRAVRPDNVDGRLFVRIEFDRRFPGTSKTYAGWATLDPAWHWAVIAYEQGYEWGTARQSVRYRRDVTDVAFPEQVVSEDVTSGGRVFSRAVSDFGRPELCGAPAEQFTLEAFGLEPPGRPSAGRLFAVVASAALFAAAGVWFAVLWYRNRRPARTATVKARPAPAVGAGGRVSG